MTNKTESPPVNRRRVGGLLRQWRELAGLQTQRAAPLIGWDSTRLGRVERGIYKVSGDQVRQLAEKYGVTDAEAIAAVAASAQEPNGTGWWAPYKNDITQDYLDFITLESEADKICVWHPLLVTGLLQSPAYAREIISSASVDTSAPEKIDRVVTIRMGRQEVLSRSGKTAQVQALIPEGAFNQKFAGGPAVMREQLTRLRDLSQSPNADIRVVTADVLPHPGLGAGFTILNFPHPWPSVVSVDHRRGGSVLGEQGDLDEYEATFTKITDVALSADKSRDLITHHLERL